MSPLRLRLTHTLFRIPVAVKLAQHEDLPAMVGIVRIDEADDLSPGGVAFVRDELV